MRNYIPVFNTALGCVCEQENKGQTPNNTKENGYRLVHQLAAHLEEIIWTKLEDCILI